MTQCSARALSQWVCKKSLILNQSQGHISSYLLGSSRANEANIALGKPATQPHTSWSGSAMLAVDGNSDPDYLGDSCTHTHTNHATGSHWWQVDLLGVYNIGMVRITNRGSSATCKYAQVPLRSGLKNPELGLRIFCCIQSFASCQRFNTAKNPEL